MNPYYLQIINKMKNEITAGFFYKDNCRVCYSSKDGFYCKDFNEKTCKMKTYNITELEAIEKIKESNFN